MRERVAPFLLLVLLAGIVFAPARTAAQQSCAALTSVVIPNATITSATAINPPPDLVLALPPGPAGPAADLHVTVPFCRVEALSAPTSDSHIRF
jgi:hypothetical protein